MPAQNKSPSDALIERVFNDPYAYFTPFQIFMAYVAPILCALQALGGIRAIMRYGEGSFEGYFEIFLWSVGLLDVMLLHVRRISVAMYNACPEMRPTVRGLFGGVHPWRGWLSITAVLLGMAFLR